MRFDLLTLQLFVAVCEEQSIAKAGDREHIAASAVSKRISDLEARLNTPLFFRSSKGLELTPEAHTLLYHSRVLMRDLKQMEAELAHHATGAAGQVRVYASVSTIIQFLPYDLRDFVRAHPGIRIDLQEGTSQAALSAVAENAADLAVFGGVVPDRGLRVIPYRSDRLVALMPAAHALAGRKSVTFSDLAEFDLIGPTKGSFIDSLLLSAASAVTVPLKMPIRVNGFETVSRMVDAQLGIGLVPEQCAQLYVTTGDLVAIELAEPWARRQWNLSVREGPLPPPVRLLLDHLAAQARVPVAS